MPLRITLPTDHQFDRAVIEGTWDGPWPEWGGPWPGAVSEDYSKLMKKCFRLGHRSGRSDALSNQVDRRFYPAEHIYPESDAKVGPILHFVMAYALGYSAGLHRHRANDHIGRSIQFNVYAQVLRQLLADTQ